MTVLSELTPEKLEDIYYTAYRAGWAKGGGIDPVVQKKVRMESWQAVLDAMIAASDLEWAQRYLAMQACEGGEGGR